ncbi:MAG: LacI family DNA-binding transcriptional regulator [Defluviitaleaceae bacterium]|nr:LacI family DNA-binding transcriptional regulator [Defluviitaleaceae bacterium]
MKYAKKKVTMEDIANTLGVSKNSVSLALHDKAGVGPALRQKIIETARNLNYGGSYADFPRKKRFISVIVPEYIRNDPYFYSDIFWAIEEEAAAKGYISITSGVSREDEDALTLPSFASDGEVDFEVIGFLVIGVVSGAYIQKLFDLGLPVLTVDILYNNPTGRHPIGCVGSSNFSGGYMAAQYLLSCGHRKIGFIGPIYSAQSVYERYCGFNLALDSARVEQPGSYNILGEKGHFGLFDTIEALEPHLQRLRELPTAWFCAGDRIAVAAMNWLTQNGRRIPDDVSIIGFDDIPIAEMVLPKLTTIHVNRKLMGKLAVDNLVEMSQAGSEVYNVNLPGVLIHRDSVKIIS